MESQRPDNKQQIIDYIAGKLPPEQQSLVREFMELHQQTCQPDELRESFFAHQYRENDAIHLFLKFNDSARYIDRTYFLNEQRKKKFPEAYYDESFRGEASVKAKKFEDEIVSPMANEPESKFVSGGVKEAGSIKQKIGRHLDDYQFLLKDLVRGKIVCRNLCEVIEVIERIIKSFPERIVCFENYYMYPYYSERKDDFTFYMGCKIVLRIDEMLPYELQVMTERASVIGEINHDTVFKPGQNNALSAESREYIAFMSWLAHEMDYNDYFDLLNARQQMEQIEDGHEWHETSRKKIVRHMLETISSQLKINPVLDHRNAFKDTLKKVINEAVARGWPQQTLQIMDGKLDQYADRFITRLKEDEFRDLLYLDVRDGSQMRKLLENSGEVDLWTKGDYKNSYQRTKIERSGITKMLDCIAEESPVQRKDIFSDEKEKEISSTLENFWQSRYCPDRIMVTVYDDSEKVLWTAKKEIEKWQKEKEASGCKVEVVANYVRSKRGSNENKIWDDIDDFDYFSAYRFHEFIGFHLESAAKSGIKKENRLILLDFDGTLANNELASVKKCKAIYSALMQAVKEIALELVENELPEPRESTSGQVVENIIRQRREMIKKLYGSIQDLWQRKIRRRKKDAPYVEYGPDIPLGLIAPPIK